MLEIFRSDYGVPDDYADNDTVFGEHGKLNVVPYLKYDMHAYAWESVALDGSSYINWDWEWHNPDN